MHYKKKNLKVLFVKKLNKKNNWIKFLMQTQMQY